MIKTWLDTYEINWLEEQAKQYDEDLVYDSDWDDLLFEQDLDLDLLDDIF